MQYSQSFDASGATLTARATLPAGTPGSIAATSTGFGAGVSLDYNATTGSYTIHDGSLSRTFLPSDRSSADSNAVITVYAQTSGSRDDQLVLYNPGAGNTQLALTYVSYGAWQTTVNNTSSLDVRQQFFVHGIRQAANAPSTGFASYTTRPDGFWTTTNGFYALGGTSTFTANFSNLTVNTTLNLTGTNVVDSTLRSLGVFNGAGTIAALGGGFAGNLVHAGADAGGNVYSGGFSGAFFGPTGSEVGYTFKVTGANGAAVGAVVGKAN